MSIQPNRVINRIIEQVDRSDWPSLTSSVLTSESGGESIRFYRVPQHERYATSLHFWVHALREELAATGQRHHLVGAACHAMGKGQSRSEWLSELEAFIAVGGLNAVGLFELHEFEDESRPVEIYRMFESVCRRSSVASDGRTLMAHFWGHGSPITWRRRTECRGVNAS